MIFHVPSKVWKHLDFMPWFSSCVVSKKLVAHVNCCVRKLWLIGPTEPENFSHPTHPGERRCINCIHALLVQVVGTLSAHQLDTLSNPGCIGMHCTFPATLSCAVKTLSVRLNDCVYTCIFGELSSISIFVMDDWIYKHVQMVRLLCRPRVTCEPLD